MVTMKAQAGSQEQLGLQRVPRIVLGAKSCVQAAKSKQAWCKKPRASSQVQSRHGASSIEQWTTGAHLRFGCRCARTRVCALSLLAYVHATACNHGAASSSKDRLGEHKGSVNAGVQARRFARVACVPTVAKGAAAARGRRRACAVACANLTCTARMRTRERMRGVLAQLRNFLCREVQTL